MGLIEEINMENTVETGGLTKPSLSSVELPKIIPVMNWDDYEATPSIKQCKIADPDCVACQ